MGDDNRKPDSRNTQIGSHVSKVLRPDRAKKVAMTTHVPRRLRKAYERLKADLDDATMQELQFIALATFLSNFRRVPRIEWQAKWEALRREFANQAIDGFGDD